MQAKHQNTRPEPFFGGSSFLWFECFNPTVENPVVSLTAESKTALFPDLTSFRHIASCFLCNKNYGLLRELPATQQSILFTKSRWIPKYKTNCNKLGHQQVVHIPHSLQALTYLTFCIGNQSGSKVHSKSAYPVDLQKKHHWFGTGQASQPLQAQKAYSIYFNLMHVPTMKCKALLSRNNLNWISSCLTLQTLPSYSRKPGLFGHIVSDLREAWQSVSTISRSKLAQHKHSPGNSKTIWPSRE